MNIYKLNYPNREIAIFDLIAKGVYVETNEGLIYGDGIHSVVEIGQIMSNTPEIDKDLNIIVEPTFFNNYSIDVMSEKIITFESESKPVDLKHNFNI